jgi:hypothetical protein
MANRKSRAAAMILALAILCTTALFAHEGGKHFKGSVKSIDATSLTIVTTTKETITLKLLPETKFVKSGQPASVQDLKTGERVVVHAKQNGTSWEAEMVQFGAIAVHAAP